MTATPAEDALAAQTQAAGEAADARHQADALAVHEASGSAVTIEAAASSDDVAVSWSNADTTAQPVLRPTDPPPVGQYEIHGPPAA
jgi:hypothetical protein